MAQRAVPMRKARLGRAVGATGDGEAVQGVVLLLPGGRALSTGRPSPLSSATTAATARRLARDGRADGLVAHVVHYRNRGWNGAAAHPVADAHWAADEVIRRYGDVSICLAGTGMGARAALRAGGHPAVNSVLALAPWLPERPVASEPLAAEPLSAEPLGAESLSAESLATRPLDAGPSGSGPAEWWWATHQADGNRAGAEEPVAQLADRRVLIVHGTNDQRTDPELSYRLALRAKKINRDICRFEVHTDGHALAQHRAEVLALSSNFVRGALFAHPFARPLTDALAAPPPLGLRMPLAAGFGSARRR
ncbi:alpha/beta hydrolase [Streptomyces pathocidini]|uniref:alpha/beta hydrolase n=1 Tax=Streptomyces pathocidini TaxID=1650571 RepID=UPI0033D1D2DD